MHQKQASDWCMRQCAHLTQTLGEVLPWLALCGECCTPPENGPLAAVDGPLKRLTRSNDSTNVWQCSGNPSTKATKQVDHEAAYEI